MGLRLVILTLLVSLRGRFLKQLGGLLESSAVICFLETKVRMIRRINDSHLSVRPLQRPFS